MYIVILNKCHFGPYSPTTYFFLVTMLSRLLYVHLVCCFWLLHCTPPCVNTAFCLSTASGRYTDCSQLITIPTNTALQDGSHPLGVLCEDLSALVPSGSDSKGSASSAGDQGSIPGSGRSPGVGNGNSLQYSYLENPMDRGAGGLQSMRSQRVRHDWAINTLTFT